MLGLLSKFLPFFWGLLSEALVPVLMVEVQGSDFYMGQNNHNPCWKEKKISLIDMGKYKD
jgi:hypothetical protein